MDGISCLVQNGEFPGVYDVSKVVDFIVKEIAFLWLQPRADIGQQANDWTKMGKMIRDWIGEYKDIFKIKEG